MTRKDEKAIEALGDQQLLTDDLERNRTQLPECHYTRSTRKGITSDRQVTAPNGYCGDEYGESSTGSQPKSIFDMDYASMGTYHSTVPTSYGQVQSGKSPSRPKSSGLDMPPEFDPTTEFGKAASTDGSVPKIDQLINSHDSDTETIFSIRSHLDDGSISYTCAFSCLLRQDITDAFGVSQLSEIPVSYLNSVLTAFAWRLHGESSTPFEWEASTIIRQKRA